jgi:hypothetical protein
MIANTAQGPPFRVRASVGSVVHIWSGTSVLMRPVRRRRARLRTFGVGASDLRAYCR